MIPFVQARHYHKGRREPIRLVVVHDMEAPQGADTAERVARWFAGCDRAASAHYCVDQDSVVQCVRDTDTAFHAPGANAAGIGIEHAGYARQSAHEWLGPANQAMLRRSAALTARICRQWNIPVRKLDPGQLRAGVSGICGHLDVTHAWRRTDHTDPGTGFPWERWLGWVGDTTKPQDDDMGGWGFYRFRDTPEVWVANPHHLRWMRTEDEVRNWASRLGMPLEPPRNLPRIGPIEWTELLWLEPVNEDTRRHRDACVATWSKQ